MKQTNLACVLSIAGTDPSGGAGIHADIKSISATGAYAATVITALVSQNTQGVQAIEQVSAEFVQQQLDSVLSDLDVNAFKIGMLHDERIIEVISKTLINKNPPPVVFDPVMVAKDGSTLLDLATISLIKDKIIPFSYLITPNLYEAEQLLAYEITHQDDMQRAAIELGKRYKVNVLIKGGHLNTEAASDILYDNQRDISFWFDEERVTTSNTHGTGCSLSSAIASYLAQGMPLFEAVSSAKRYITQAIKSGQRFHIGKGNGPVDHFYFLGNRHDDY